METQQTTRSPRSQTVINQQRCAAALIIIGVGFCLAMMLMALNAPVFTERDASGHLISVVGIIAGVSDGTVPALSVFLIIIGIIFYYPSLINSSQRDMGVDTSQFSSMRLAVLMVVCCFVLINIKNGWAHGLTRDQLEPWWIILAVAIGSKALQYFAEVKRLGLTGLTGATDMQNMSSRRAVQGPSAAPDPAPPDSSTPATPDERGMQPQQSQRSEQSEQSDQSETQTDLRQRATPYSVAHTAALRSTAAREQLGTGRAAPHVALSPEMSRLLQHHLRALSNKHSLKT